MGNLTSKAQHTGLPRVSKLGTPPLPNEYPLSVQKWRSEIFSKHENHLKEVWEASEEKSSESGIGALLAALINEPQLIHGYSEVAIIARIVRNFLGNLPLPLPCGPYKRRVDRTKNK